MSSISPAPVSAQSVTPISGQSSCVDLSSGVDPAGERASSRSENARSPVRVSSGRQVILDRAAFDAAIQSARVSASRVPPDSNTGGKSIPLAELFHRPRLVSSDSVSEEWEIWAYGAGSWRRFQVHVPVQQAAMVDTLTFTFKESAFQALPSCSGFVSDSDLCLMVGEVLRDRVGIVPSGPIGRRNLYAHTRALVSSSDDSIRAGFVAAGGNADTVCVHLTGEGCATLSRAQWVGLYALLVSLDAKITRVDLAHDDFDGVASVDVAVESFKAGGFAGKGRPPASEVAGDWLTPGGGPKGRTFYVGARDSGKLLRVYEKGRQLGDPLSPWVRWELEIHAEKRVIPFLVLLRPGEYLAGAYPGERGTGWISATQSVIKTMSNRLKISYSAMIRYCRVSYGRLLFAMRDIEDSASAVLDALTEGVCDVPRRLIMPPVGAAHV